MSEDHFDPETIERLRYALFDSIGGLSDADFQRATWLDPEMQNPHYTYVEFVESFYDVCAGNYDATDPEAENAPLNHLVMSGVISPIERDLIWPLHMALRGHDAPDPYDHHNILDDPEWGKVCVTASSVRDGLLGLQVNSFERACFENELPSAAAKRWP